MTNDFHSVFYVGITADIQRRSWQHHEFPTGFVYKYNLTKLVYYEQFTEIGYAIRREKLMKRWRRSWKINLINKTNPQWKDLHEDLIR